MWKKAIAFAELVYSLTKNFPPDERFGLTSQIRRAAVSVASNIAEGSARSPADFAKFLSYSTGSTFEVITQATMAKNLNLITPDAYQNLYTDAAEISRMLSGLRRSLGPDS